MTIEKNQSNQLSQLKQAVTALKEMRAKLESLQRQQSAPIAVIGMGCRFPGGANSTSQYWELLKAGRDVITELPARQFTEETKRKLERMGIAEAKWGGFLDEVDRFDPAFFGITPREAAAMDPQQRLILEVTWEALEDAGLRVPAMAGSKTGVFLGVHSHSSDYFMMQKDSYSEEDLHMATGTAHNVIAGRLSYLFDWQGPSLVVDTACSSSLVALHLAVQSLRTGESDLGVAGGSNLMLAPEVTILAARMGMLAPDGRCKTFDESANGFVRGEGCGVVVLKRLAEAIKDGDPVLAIIRGSAVNQDGKSNGLTAPNGLSQQAVIRAALKNAHVDANQIGYVEAHGTGTALGDPIEADSLSQVLTAGRSAGQKCLLGSAKANIGHLEGAAGIAGFIKAVLVLRNQAVPPQIHFKRLNPHISLGKEFEIPTALRAWQSGARARFAAVSSFGWSGTNAHVVLEEAGAEISPAKESVPVEPRLLAISGHTPEALKAMARLYVEFLNIQSGEPNESLRDICYTAGARRTHQEYRLAVVGVSCPEMAKSLKRYLEGREDAAVFTGRAAENSQQPKPVVPLGNHHPGAASQEKMSQVLAAEFVAGGEIDWSKVFPAGSRHVALPMYPWQKKKYWFGAGSGASPEASKDEAWILPGKRLASPHPIYELDLHADSSPAVADHRIAGTPVVPGAVYLQLALEAAMQEFGLESGQGDYPRSWTIKNLRMIAPLRVEEGITSRVQTLLSRESADLAGFEIFSMLESGSRNGEQPEQVWTLHASGELLREAEGQSSNVGVSVDLLSLRRRCAREIDGGEFYETIARYGVDLGARLRTVERLWLGQDEALGRVVLSAAKPTVSPSAAQGILIDGILQILPAAAGFSTPADGQESLVLAEIGFCELAKPLPRTLWCHARVQRSGESPDAFSGEIEAFDEEGRRVARLSGLRVQRIRAGKRPDWFYEVGWREFLALQKRAD